MPNPTQDPCGLSGASKVLLMQTILVVIGFFLALAVLRGNNLSASSSLDDGAGKSLTFTIDGIRYAIERIPLEEDDSRHAHPGQGDDKPTTRCEHGGFTVRPRGIPPVFLALADSLGVRESARKLWCETISEDGDSAAKCRGKSHDVCLKKWPRMEGFSVRQHVGHLLDVAIATNKLFTHSHIKQLASKWHEPGPFPFLFVLTKSAPSNFAQRRSMRETWLAEAKRSLRCRCRPTGRCFVSECIIHSTKASWLHQFVLGLDSPIQPNFARALEEQTTQGDILFYPGKDNHAELTAKMFWAIHHVKTNYDFECLLITDDDSYLQIGHVISFLLRGTPNIFRDPPHAEHTGTLKDAPLSSSFTRRRKQCFTSPPQRLFRQQSPFAQECSFLLSQFSVKEAVQTREQTVQYKDSGRDDVLPEFYSCDHEFHQLSRIVKTLKVALELVHDGENLADPDHPAVAKASAKVWRKLQNIVRKKYGPMQTIVTENDPIQMLSATAIGRKVGQDLRIIFETIQSWLATANGRKFLFPLALLLITSPWFVMAAGIFMRVCRHAFGWRARTS